METKKKSFDEKEQRKSDALLIAVLLCILAATPITCWGDGLLQGYSTFEQIRSVILLLIVGVIGYAIGYYVPLRKWMNSKQEEDAE